MYDFALFAAQANHKRASSTLRKPRKLYTAPVYGVLAQRTGLIVSDKCLLIPMCRERIGFVSYNFTCRRNDNREVRAKVHSLTDISQ